MLYMMSECSMWNDVRFLRGDHEDFEINSYCEVV
jgi:hypothetical protein